MNLKLKSDMPNLGLADFTVVLMLQVNVHGHTFQRMWVDNIYGQS